MNYKRACEFLVVALALTGCAQDFETVHFQKPTDVADIVRAMPAPVINITVAGDTINNNTNVQTGSVNATGGSSSAATGSVSSGNSSATGGAGGSSSAGNSTANNSSSSNSTNSSTNSGSARNQANNSNTQTVSQEQNSQDNTRAGLPNKGHSKKKHPKSCKEDLDNGLVCKVYDLKANPPSGMPNYSQLTPVGSIVVDKLDVVDMSYANSFPKFPSNLKYLLENYGLSCSGYLDVATAGTHTFYLTSDDGSKLYVDGSLVVDNDGLHSTRAYQNSVSLSKGLHPIKIEYFQGPRTQISLVLEYSNSLVTRSIIPANMYKH